MYTKYKYNPNAAQTQPSPDQIQSRKHREIHIQTHSHSQKESGAGLLKVLKTARFGFFTVWTPFIYIFYKLIALFRKIMEHIAPFYLTL